MSVFRGIKDAKVSEGGIYILPGTYPDLEVMALKTGATRKKVGFFVAEFKVLKSLVETRPAGSEMSWMVTFDKDAALGNVKGFVAKLLGVTVEEVDEAVCEYITTDKNPMKGKHIAAYAWNKPTQAGKPFTRVKWYAVGDASISEQSEAA